MLKFVSFLSRVGRASFGIFQIIKLTIVQHKYTELHGTLLDLICLHFQSLFKTEHFGKIKIVEFVI